MSSTPAYLTSLQIGAAKLFDVYGDVITTAQSGANFFAGNAVQASSGIYTGKVVTLDQTIVLLSNAGAGTANPSANTADTAFILAQKDANIASITVNNYALSNIAGTFSGDYLSYETQNILYTCSPAAPNGTSMTGVQAQTGFLRSSTLPLYDGVNVMSITTTPVNPLTYSSVTYLITVVLVSSNTHLLSLIPSTALYNYEPAFDSNYNPAISNIARSLEVAPTVTSLSLVPTTVDPSCRILINNQAVASGSSSSSIAISDNTVINVSVTAADNVTVQNWIVTVNYATIVSNLSSLSVGFINSSSVQQTYNANWVGGIAPTNANLQTTFSYANLQTVDYNAQYITLNAAADNGASYVSLTVNGGVESPLYMGSHNFQYSCNLLNPGNNAAVIKVYNALGVLSSSYTMTYNFASSSPILNNVVPNIGSITPSFNPLNYTQQASLLPAAVLGNSALYTNYVVNIGSGSSTASLVMSLLDSGCIVSYCQDYIGSNTWTQVPIYTADGNGNITNWYADGVNKQFTLTLTGLSAQLSPSNGSNQNALIRISAPGANGSSTNYVYYNLQFVNPSSYLNTLNIFNTNSLVPLALTPSYVNNINVYTCNIGNGSSSVSSIDLNVSWSGSYSVYAQINSGAATYLTSNQKSVINLGGSGASYTLTITMNNGSNTNVYTVTLYNIAQTVLLSGLVVNSETTSTVSPAGTTTLLSLSPSFNNMIFAYNVANNQMYGSVVPTVSQPNSVVIQVLVNGSTYTVASGSKQKFTMTGTQVPVIITVTDRADPSISTSYQVIFVSNSSNTGLTQLEFEGIASNLWTPQIGVNTLNPFQAATYNSPTLYDTPTTRVRVTPQQPGTVCYLLLSNPGSEPEFVQLVPGVYSPMISIASGVSQSVKVYVYPTNYTAAPGLFNMVITSEASTDSVIASLTMSNTDLVFNSAITSYTVNVLNGASLSVLNALANNSHATLSYNLNSGGWNTGGVPNRIIDQALSNFNTYPISNTLLVRCVAEAGSAYTTIYTFNIVSLPYSKANSISVLNQANPSGATAFTLSPNFDPNVFVYSSLVNNSSTYVWVNIAHNVNSSVTSDPAVAQLDLTYTTPTLAVYKVPVPPNTLNISSNPVSFTISAFGVPSNIYYVNVVRPVNNVILDGLNLYDSSDNLIPLTPAFDGQVLSYQISRVFNGQTIRVNLVGRPASFVYYINGISVTNTSVVISNSTPLSIAVQPIGNPSITTLYNVAPTL